MSKSIAIYLPPADDKNRIQQEALRLQKLFEDKNLSCKTIDISRDPKRTEVLEKAAHENNCKPPYVCIDDVFIGGSREITAFEATGELDRIINDR